MLTWTKWAELVSWAAAICVPYIYFLSFSKYTNFSEEKPFFLTDVHDIWMQFTLDTSSLFSALLQLYYL